jgi:uncharacterized protein YbjT (DUF2867 family)
LNGSALTLIDSDALLPSKVIVSGASGRTGKLVFKKLHDKYPKIETIGIVRSEKSAKKLMKEIHCGLDELVICDITEVNDNYEYPKSLENAEAFVICTSAVPYVAKLSILKAILMIPFNVIRGRKMFNFRDLFFKYKSGQYPEKVDYEGQINQINLAKKIGVDHIVLVSSMGGTDENNFLNSIGKNKKGSGNGDILIWKRKAEKYLVDSGHFYTIIHPGGLLDSPGGVEELVLDIDDNLLKHDKKSISRSDVANLCIAALSVGRNQKLSFDCIAKVEKESKIKPPEQALREFLETKKHTNYQ